MTLSRTKIVGAAYEMLRDHGLAGVSMRRIAQSLGVQPGALYYHVESKQDLLAAVAERILRDRAQVISSSDAAVMAVDLRSALLPVRDSADVVSFAYAFRPEVLLPFQRLHALFGEKLPEPQARWAAQTLLHYVLGFVAEEQNRTELVRADVLTDPPAARDADNAFLFGVEAILRGLADDETADSARIP